MRLVCSHNDDLVAEEVSWHVLQQQFRSSPSLWHKLVELDSVAGREIFHCNTTTPALLLYHISGVVFVFLIAQRAQDFSKLVLIDFCHSNPAVCIRPFVFGFCQYKAPSNLNFPLAEG